MEISQGPGEPGRLGVDWAIGTRLLAHRIAAFPFALAISHHRRTSPNETSMLAVLQVSRQAHGRLPRMRAKQPARAGSKEHVDCDVANVSCSWDLPCATRSRSMFSSIG